MKPIAQTFYVNEPENGVAGVYLTSIDLFFKSKSLTFGVQVQIRTTDNGNPTTSILPFGDLTLPASSVNVSDDASVRTNFCFNSPVFLQTATSYAIVIIPSAGNPDYKIWTAELAPGTVDVTTNKPIKTNNDTGSLFLSSNDIQFTAIQTEDIKFALYIAQFKSNSGTAVFTPKSSDILIVRDKIGDFLPREVSVVSNNSYELAKLTITSNTGPFTVGEVIYQANSTANLATGKIYSANSSSIKITNSVGTWVTTYQVRGVTSISNAVVSATRLNVATTLNSNSVTVPFTNLFSTGQMIYVGTSNRTNLQPAYITAINSDGITLTVSTNVQFTDSNALLGRIRGDGLLYGITANLSDNEPNPNRIGIILDNVTSNSILNFANSKGQYVIGTISGASANIASVHDSLLNAIVPQFADNILPDTNIDYSFLGTRATISKFVDAEKTPVINNVEKEFLDYSRTIMSRSNEYNNLSSGRKGEYTASIYADFGTANNKISPAIDTAAKSVLTVISNSIAPKERISGYRLLFEDNPFNPYDYIYQANSSGFTYGVGLVNYADSTQVIITNVEGYFNRNSNVMLQGTPTVNSSVTGISNFNEYTNNNNKFVSRYISKNVILAENQDAEDIRVFLTAYRPAKTDFLVYGRFQNGEDPDSFRDKNWTLLDQISSPSLLSSSVNTNDFIELEYGLPKSVQLIANSCSCNSTSDYVTVPTSVAQTLNRLDKVYFADTASDKFFVANVRRIESNKKVVLSDIPPLTIANAAFGIIPNLETINGAFVYTANNNVMRYVAGDYTVYDTYKIFAIKIVPVSESLAIVPRAKDMRAIALQV